MKNLINFFAATLILTSSVFATTTPEIIIDVEAVEVVSISAHEFFVKANYNEGTENLSFVTLQDISVIQILNAEGELEFQLPVMSNIVKINKNLFGQGQFQLGFVIEGKSEMVFTEVTIK